MPIFYHVSTNIHHDGTFIPRIPQNRHEDENDTIPRVCVSSTIEGCFTAMPNGGYSLDMLNISTSGLYLIFRIDTDKLGILPDNIYTSDVLYQRDLVRDADLSDEHWITSSFIVPKEEQTVILLKSWDVEETDLIPAYIHDLADKNYDGDYCEAYRKEFYTSFVPSAVYIKNLRFLEERVKPGETILYRVEHFHQESIKRYLEDIFGIPVHEEDLHTLSFSVNTDVTLLPVFQYHKQLIELYNY